MSFPAIQAAYAARGIPTYPLSEAKTPAVKAYTKIGAPYSAQLALRFPDATAGGFVAGARSRVTVVDIDSTDDRLVDEVQRRFGVTPLQVLTPSGGRHLYYRHGGETRRIRPLPDVDILGGGNCVAALSVVPKGRYELVRGTLDDLDRLPRLAAAPAAPARPSERVPEGKRGTTLFNHCRAIVGHCDSLEQLLDVARTWAEDHLATPLPDAEIVKTCGSVWKYRAGRRMFMPHVVEGPVFERLTAVPEVWGVYCYLMAENGPDAEFLIADGLGEAKGWSRRLVPAARKTLLEVGVVECVRPPRKGQPGLYRWRTPAIE